MESSRVSHQLMGLLSLETPRPEDGVSRATSCSHPAWGKHNASSPAVVLALPMALTSYPFSKPSSDVCNQLLIKV